MRPRLVVALIATLLAGRAAAQLTVQAAPQSCTEYLVSWSDPSAHPGQLYRIDRSENGAPPVTLVARTTLGQRSYLDASVVCCFAGQVYSDGCCSTPYAYTVTALDGVIAIACGDVNGDGFLTIADALVIAQFDVGLRACGVAPFGFPQSCDVNGDGACNIGDALFVAQCTVGVRSCAFTCGPFVCGGSI